jgi:hypothetical protein|tara:strand:- start:43 stop:408 length:366 start_codon:yes stop_codon:yes gene_type:complete
MSGIQLKAVRVAKGVPAWDIMLSDGHGEERNVGMMSDFPMEKSYVCTLRADNVNAEIELRHKARSDMLAAIRKAVEERQERLEEWYEAESVYQSEMAADRAAEEWWENRYEHLAEDHGEPW